MSLVFHGFEGLRASCGVWCFLVLGVRGSGVLELWGVELKCGTHFCTFVGWLVHAAAVAPYYTCSIMVGPKTLF